MIIIMQIIINDYINVLYVFGSLTRTNVKIWDLLRVISLGSNLVSLQLNTILKIQIAVCP